MRRLLLGAVALVVLGGCGSTSLLESEARIFDLGETSLRNATTVVLSPEGNRVFWVAVAEMCVGDLTNDAAAPQCVTADIEVDAAVWNPDESAVALSQMGWAGIYVFRPGTGELENVAPEDCSSLEGCPSRLAAGWASDGQRIASVTVQGEAASIEILPVAEGETDLIPLPADVTPGPLYWGHTTGDFYISMASAGADGRSWDVWTYSLNEPTPALLRAGRAMVVEESQDGRLALIASSDLVFELVDLETGEGAPLEVPESGDRLLSAAFSPDGAAVAFIWRRTDGSGNGEDVFSIVGYDADARQFGSRIDLMTTSDLPETDGGPWSFGQLSPSPPWLVWRPDDTFVVPAGGNRFVVLDVGTGSF